MTAADLANLRPQNGGRPQGPFAGHKREQRYVRLVEVGDRPEEQQLIVYPGVVARDPGALGAAESAPLVTQRDVVWMLSTPGKQLWQRSSETAFSTNSMSAD